MSVEYFDFDELAEEAIIEANGGEIQEGNEDYRNHCDDDGPGDEYYDNLEEEEQYAEYAFRYGVGY